MRVGVLAVQGAFAEMAAYWRAKGADVFEIRQRADLSRGMDLLALPGGESTVQGKLLKDLGLFDPLKSAIDGGLSVFATCAGLILLAEKVEDGGERSVRRAHDGLRREVRSRRLALRWNRLRHDPSFRPYHAAHRRPRHLALRKMTTSRLCWAG